jgi:hypothetical protein
LSLGEAGDVRRSTHPMMADDMWFLTNLIERYTNNVAKTFVKLAAMEAEANRRALEEYRARRRNQVDDSREGLFMRPAMVHPHTGETLTAECAQANAVHVPQDLRRDGPIEREDPADALKARARASLKHLPMGVRGDVVVAYVNAFIGAQDEEVGRLLDKLSKDKKVRVAELEIIVSAALDEEPQKRKKADHVARLRRRLLTPRDRPMTMAEAKHAIHAAE